MANNQEEVVAEPQPQNNQPSTLVLSTPSRKRKSIIPPNAALVWARDGDHVGATEHPAYLLSSTPDGEDDAPPSSDSSSRNNNVNSNSDSNDDAEDGNHVGDEEEYVWVQWASNGTTSHIPKSNLSSGLSSRRSRRSPSAALGSAASPAIKPKAKKSRLSLTKKQRQQFKEHHYCKSSKKNGKRSEKKKVELQQKKELIDHVDAPSYAIEQKSSPQTSGNSVELNEIGAEPQPMMQECTSDQSTRPLVEHKLASRVSLSPCFTMNSANLFTSSSLDPTNTDASKQQQSSATTNKKKKCAEIEIIDILDSSDEEEEGGEEKKVEDEWTTNVRTKSTTEKLSKNSYDDMPIEEAIPTNRKFEKRKKSSLNVHIPGESFTQQHHLDLSSSQTTPPLYTHRSSAYVQHLAEACTLIMTDARWHTSTTKTTSARGLLLQQQQQQPLFLWERRDDLSAVKALMSLYDAPTTDTTTQSELKSDDKTVMDVDTKSSENESGPNEERDEVFERTMHLYSRMFHRKGPWFDLADLYSRYYAPKSRRKNTTDESLEGDEEGDGSPDGDTFENGENAAKDETNDKKKAFFTPRSTQQVNGKSTQFFAEGTSSKNNNSLATQEAAIGQLFQDIIRLLSMGLIRSFQSEYECGQLSGSVKANGRGTRDRGVFLSADERREVLRRLGGAKTPKVARASLGSSRKNNGHPPMNEILSQMQSQRTVMSSFVKAQTGGGKRMLPVIKHVDNIFIRKLAQKVAYQVSDAPRKAELDEAVQMIHRVWATVKGGHENVNANFSNGIATTFRLREAPLKTLRRCMRLFLCAGSGPGAMRGNGTNSWISVLVDEVGSDADPNSAPSSSNWHNVSYPGCASRLGLEHYELGHCYTPLSLAEESIAKEENKTISNRSAMTSVFTRHCEFTLWELGVEIRGFIDQVTEAYELEKMMRRRREKEAAKMEKDGFKSDAHTDSFNGQKVDFLLLSCDVLAEEGRRRLVRTILISCFSEGELPKHATLELSVSDLCEQIEAEILLMLNENGDNDGDGFISDTERVIAATTVICHKILQLRLQHPSTTLASLAQRPWLRHLCFDAILTYMLWDGVPLFERKGYHLMAVSMLQTILFGDSLCTYDASSSVGEPFYISDTIRSEMIVVKSYIQCLLPRRNRGKAYERLLIDLAHAERRHKKTTEPKPKKKKAKEASSKGKDETNKEEITPAIQILSKALLKNAEAFGSIPYCSLRNLARRLKARLPQTNEKSVLKIRPKNNNDWSPETDTAVANAIVSQSDDSAAGKRCAFVGWEMDGDQGNTAEAKRSLNVEELAMEEYHNGRIPTQSDEVKGQWRGWHNEGGHVRALFRVLCLHHLMEYNPRDRLSLDEDATIFLTPYQFSPHDLHVGSFIAHNGDSNSPIRGFYERRQAVIASFLSNVSQMDDAALSNLVYESVKRRWDQHSDDRSRLKDPRIIRDATELKTLSMVACALGPAALASIFRTLCFDYRHWSGGLPDLLLVRARYAAATSDLVFVDLADWIGEGFSKANIDGKEIHEHINMLIDRDDEFLGCVKNADGNSLQQERNVRKKQGSAKLELPKFPNKLEFIHEDRRVKADCMFVEVKSANDRLSERQEDWLSILEGCTNARVCKFTSSSSNKK